MKRISKTITIEYDEFEPGDRVKISSRRSGLEWDKVYVVTEFSHPYLDGGERYGIVFVEGHKYGIDAIYLMLAEEEDE